MDPAATEAGRRRSTTWPPASTPWPACPMRPRLDLERVVAIGHSAGGQFALWAATRPGLPSGAFGAGSAVGVTRVVALGPSDLHGAARNRAGGASAAALLGGGPEEVRERYAAGLARRPPAVRRADRARPRRRRRGGAGGVQPQLPRGGGRRRRLLRAGEVAGATTTSALIDPASAAWAAVHDGCDARGPATRRRRPGTRADPLGHLEERSPRPSRSHLPRRQLARPALAGAARRPAPR